MEKKARGKLKVLAVIAIIAVLAVLISKLVPDIDREASFAISLLYEFELFGQTLHLTSTHVSLTIVTVVLIVLAVIVNKKVMRMDDEETPGTLVNIFELAVEAADNMVRGTMGRHAVRFRNYIATVMLFALFCNISSIWGLRPPTADYGVTLAMGLITFFLIHINGIKAQGASHFTSLFKPILLSPINIIGEVATPLSLSLRLFGNVLSGTVMMGLIYGLVAPPITTGIPAILHVYFDLFSGCIQAYVFCMLTMVYITDKIGD